MTKTEKVLKVTFLGRVVELEEVFTTGEWAERGKKKGLHLWENEESDEDTVWEAFYDGWHYCSGLTDTPQEAVSQLEERFHRAYRELGELLGASFEPKTKFIKTVALDFDGVVHSYTTRWSSPENIPDDPHPDALEAVQSYLDAGMKVTIFSARARAQAGAEAIKEWLEKHNFPVEQLTITSMKSPAVIYIDDRGFCFTGKFPSAEEVKAFKPWNR